MPFYTTGVVDSEPVAKGDAIPLILAGGAVLLFMSRGGGGGSFTCDDVHASGGTVAGIEYLEFRSSSVGPNDEAPMVIAFHGFGTPSSTIKEFQSYVGMAGGPVRLIIPKSPRLTSKYQYHTWFGPNRAGQQDQKALADSMLLAHAEMAEFIRQITHCRPTEGLPVVVGSSQGGMMGYLMASLSPQAVRGAVVAAGWLPQSLWSMEIPPIYATHGTQDTIVPFASTKQYWDTLLASGAPIETKTYDQGHVAVGPSWRRARLRKLLGYA